MIKSMDPKTGRCAVVLPQGVLFHSGKEGTIREQLIRSDKLEAIITLASGVFYSTGVSACILFLNNKKAHNHKGRICLIDGSEIYTPQRAQNILSKKDVATLYKLYTDYEDVIEKCKIVTIADVEEGGFELSVKKYIEQKAKEVVPHAKVLKAYYDALMKVRQSEDRMRELLIEGGYVNE